MSRIGKQTINIPAGVEAKIENNLLSVKGPKGELSLALRDEVSVKIENNSITSTPIRNDKFSKSLWGTYMSRIKSMLLGVVSPFSKKLLIEGVGYKWEIQGDTIKLSLGFSHPVFVKIPKGLEVKADKSELTITGIDKEAVTLFAMQIRKLKKPEPYKGKGIRYDGEVIRRKEGKKSA